MEEYCSQYGLQLFVPRTQQHFQHARDTFGYTFFRVMGIYPTFK